MSLNLLFPACALFCAAYFLLYLRHAQCLLDRQRLRGLEDVVHLRRLLEAMPQHRGMANALLQGDESFRGKLTTLQSQIDRDMGVMMAMLSGGDQWLVAARVGRIHSAWLFIKKHLNGFAAPESFARHTSLMTELLYLINDVADASGLLRLKNNNSRLIDAAVNLLPMVTETLGQARGMGAGVAARGKCTTDMRVKLHYLLDNARRILGDVAKHVEVALQGDANLNVRAGSVLENSQQSTQVFLSMLESRIINVRQVDVAPAEYYGAGTEAIQYSFELLDVINNALMARLNGDRGRAQKKLWRARLTALLILAPAIYLLLLI